MEEISEEVKNLGFNRLVVILVLLCLGVILYFIVSYFFTPSWIVGEEVERTLIFIDINDGHLGKFANLEKFVKNAQRNTGLKAAVLIRGSRGQGTRLEDFLRVNPSQLTTPPFPYVIKYGNKFYGLDIIYQFKSPIAL